MRHVYFFLHICRIADNIIIDTILNNSCCYFFDFLIFTASVLGSPRAVDSPALNTILSKLVTTKELGKFYIFFFIPMYIPSISIPDIDDNNMIHVAQFRVLLFYLIRRISDMHQNVQPDVLRTWIIAPFYVDVRNGVLNLGRYGDIKMTMDSPLDWSYNSNIYQSIQTRSPEDLFRWKTSGSIYRRGAQKIYSGEKPQKVWWSE